MKDVDDDGEIKACFTGRSYVYTNTFPKIDYEKTTAIDEGIVF